jgi:CheY-like chemotaxis protein
VRTTHHEKSAVLLVEDDRDARDAIRDVLEEEGYRVLTAANGAEALVALPALTRPGVVLLDLMMPVMSGWEFLTAARERGLLGGVSVIVLSASPVKTVPRGVAGWLGKPVHLEDLLGAVARHGGSRGV